MPIDLTVIHSTLVAALGAAKVGTVTVNTSAPNRTANGVLIGGASMGCKQVQVTTLIPHRVTYVPIDTGLTEKVRSAQEIADEVLRWVRAA